MRFVCPILIGVVLCLTAPNVFAEDNPSLEFDISSDDTSVVVWLDMSVILTSDRVRELEEGVELGLQYNIELVRPKRFWGETVCYDQNLSWLIGYKIVTDEYYIEIPDSSDSIQILTFESLARLHRHLADSVIISLVSRNCDNSSERFTLKVKVTAISLTSTNFTPATNTPPKPNSALQLLFKTFLDITGHGRTEFKVTSEPFTFSDLSSEK